MKRIARVVVAAAVAAAAGISAAASASADTTPPIWQVGGSSFATLGDTHNVGTLSFFDLNGNQITSGPANTGFAYVEADGLPASDLLSTKKYVYLTAATPTPAEPAGTFPTAALSVKTQWPNAAAPGALGTDTNPVFSGPVAAAAAVPQNDSLDTYSSGDKAQTSTADGYAGVYEIRAFLTGTGGSEADYASADVQYDAVTDTWTEIFPDAGTTTTSPGGAVSTTTSVNVTPGSGLPNSSQTLSATVVANSGTDSPAGSVDFTDGANDLGTEPLAGSGGSATASLTTSLGAGQHTITATFEPTDSTAFSTSNGSAPTFSLTVPPPVGTTTTLTVSPGSGIPNSVQTLVATVTASTGTLSPAGGIDFRDGAVDLGSKQVSGSGGTAAASLVTTALGAGSHTITAIFSPSDSTAFVASAANSPAFTLTAPALGGGGATIVQSPVESVGPALLGPAQVGKAEQVVSGSWSGTPSPTFTYQWLRDGIAINGATSTTYTIASADYKHHLSVRVTATNAAGSAQAVTAALLPKVGNKPTEKNLKLKGSVVHGKKVQVAIGTWSVSKLSFSYQWKLNGKAIKGATKSSYTLPASAKHKTLTLVVTAKETGFTTAVVTTKSVKVG